jgi:site-specific recombinase XerD
MKVSFWLAGSKQTRAGLAPIYARITVKGKRSVNFSTGLTIYPHQWKPGGNGFIKGEDELTKVQNEQLIKMRADILNLYNDLERREQMITSKKLKQLYLGENLAAISLKQAIIRYIEDRKKEQLTTSYLRTLEVRQRAIFRYLVEKELDEIKLFEIGISALAAIEDYHKREKHFDQSTINKIINLIKSVVDYAVRKDWLEFNPLTSHKNKKLKRKPKVYLTESEVKRIQGHQFASHRLQKIAYLFLFQCYTGLAFVDLMRFEKSWVRLGENGKYWIHTERKKVAGSECKIPLFKSALSILDDLNWKIEQIHNGNYNAYLKEIAVIVGIDKNLTTHVARKTFGNMLLDKNVSLEVVSSMYGHSSTKTTLSYYVDISEKRISDETSHLNL